MTSGLSFVRDEKVALEIHNRTLFSLFFPFKIKEIQEDLDKLRSQNVKHPKKVPKFILPNISISKSIILILKCKNETCRGSKCFCDCLLSPGQWTGWLLLTGEL